MSNDGRSIGDKLRAIDEQAARSSAIPESTPSNKEPAEGSRETAGGITNRSLDEERENQQRVN